jgi:hypothetical protein
MESRGVGLSKHEGETLAYKTAIKKGLEIYSSEVKR